MKRQKHSMKKLALGAQTVAAALAWQSSHLYAAELDETCQSQGAENCEQQAPEIIEEIRVHGVRYSQYLQNKSGDLRRIGDISETPQVLVRKLRFERDIVVPSWGHSGNR